MEEVVKSGSPGQEAMEGTLCAVQSAWVLNGKLEHPVGTEALESEAHLDKRCRAKTENEVKVWEDLLGLCRRDLWAGVVYVCCIISQWSLNLSQVTQTKILLPPPSFHEGQGSQLSY